MKAINYLRLALTVLFIGTALNSCTKEDETDLLEGTWGLTSREITQFNSDGTTETFPEGPFDPFNAPEQGDYKITYTSVSENSYSYIVYYYYSGTWTEYSSGTAEKADDVLTSVSGYSGTLTTEIESLTSTTLITVSTSYSYSTKYVNRSTYIKQK